MHLPPRRLLQKETEVLVIANATPSVPRPASMDTMCLVLDSGYVKQSFGIGRSTAPNTFSLTYRKTRGSMFHAPKHQSTSRGATPRSMRVINTTIDIDCVLRSNGREFWCWYIHIQTWRIGCPLTRTVTLRHRLLGYSRWLQWSPVFETRW